MTFFPQKSRDDLSSLLPEVTHPFLGLARLNIIVTSQPLLSRDMEVDLPSLCLGSSTRSKNQQLRTESPLLGSSRVYPGCAVAFVLGRMRSALDCHFSTFKKSSAQHKAQIHLRSDAIDHQVLFGIDIDAQIVAHSDSVADDSILGR